MSTSNESSQSTKKNHAVSGAHATEQLDALEASLHLDVNVPPNDQAQIHALRRVSTKALLLAAEIVDAEPERFPGFGGFTEAATYVAEMSPIADRAIALAKHVQKSIGNRYAPAAKQTLALYAIVKGLGRLPENEAMRERITALKAELAPKRSTPKLTLEEKRARQAAKARAKRLRKAQEVIARDGAPTPAVTPSPEPAPPVPPPSVVNGVGSPAAH